MTVDFSHKDPQALLLGADEGPYDAPRPINVQCFIRTNFAAYVGEWCDYKRNEDGSLTYVLGGALPQAGDQLDVECLVITNELPAQREESDSTRTRDTYAMTVLVLPAEEQLSKTLQQEIKSLGLALESITMTRTPLAQYYDVANAVSPTATEEQRERTQYGIWIRLLDVRGEPLPGGMSLSGSVDSLDDAPYVASGSLALSAIPDIVMLELYDGHYEGGLWASDSLAEIANRAGGWMYASSIAPRPASNL